MNKFSAEISSGAASLRIDIFSEAKRDFLVEDDTFLNYRLAKVSISTEITKDKPGIIWNVDKQPKNITYKDGVLTLDGSWEEGELNKIMVTMLANEMDLNGLHPLHSSSVVYRGKMILLVGGENNHGKSMTQLEGSRRGGLVYSTETTVLNEEGTALFGSQNVYIRKRAKGTERSDLPNQDEGVRKFWDKEPEMKFYDGETKIDLAVMPGIDGHFDTQVTPMGSFEKCYQTYHSAMNFFGLNQLLCGETGLVMPIVDTDERRQHRGAFIKKFTEPVPYFMIRAKSPQLLFDEIDKIIDKM